MRGPDRKIAPRTRRSAALRKDLLAPDAAPALLRAALRENEAGITRQRRDPGPARLARAAIEREVRAVRAGL